MFDFSNPAVFLSWLVFMPAIVALIIAFLPARGETIKRISLIATAIVFIMTLGMIFGIGDWPQFLPNTAQMQHLFAYDWIQSFGIQYLMGLDGISFPLVVLTAFISMLAMAASWPIVKHEKAYCVLFLLLVTGRPMAEAWGLAFPPAAAALAREFWPGPLTLVLPGGEGRLPDRLRGPEGGIAVRHTSHALVARLVAGLGYPLTSTSANQPGQAPAPGAEAIAAIFADAIASGELLVLDGGPLGNVPPSTIVDCTGPVPRLVREGAIPRPELRRRVGRLAP